MKKLFTLAVLVLLGFWFFGSSYGGYNSYSYYPSYVHYGTVSYPAMNYYGYGGYYNYYRPSLFGFYRSW